jgi:hypothetical protein
MYGTNPAVISGVLRIEVFLTTGIKLLRSFFRISSV